jgi:hypothetical protein
MGEVVTAVYRPLPGRAADLEALVRRHFPTLRERGLVTERAPIVVRSEDGTLLEVFEWRDEAAAGEAHADPEVGALWNAMGEAGEFLCLADLPEATRRFPHFQPL